MKKIILLLTVSIFINKTYCQDRAHAIIKNGYKIWYDTTKIIASIYTYVNKDTTKYTIEKVPGWNVLEAKKFIDCRCPFPTYTHIKYLDSTKTKELVGVKNMEKITSL